MTTINYQQILDDIAIELNGLEDKGEVASYIPELKNVDPSKLGVHLTTIENDHFLLAILLRNFRFKVSQKSCL